MWLKVFFGHTIKHNMNKKNISLKNTITILISLAFLAFQLFIAIKGTVSFIITVPLHLCFALMLIFLYNPIYKKNEKLKKLVFIDYILFAAIIFITVSKAVLSAVWVVCSVLLKTTTFIISII